MSLGYKSKPDGGQGGKRGHSNMTHWEHTEKIKSHSKRQRRVASKRLIRESTKE